jgi:PadR family transcriptional regulator PadR
MKPSTLHNLGGRVKEIRSEGLLGSCHGQGGARLIQRQSEQVFFVDHGSLYLALRRLEEKKWISAKWGVSENNRKARFYSLTRFGIRSFR